MHVLELCAADLARAQRRALRGVATSSCYCVAHAGEPSPRSASLLARSIACGFVLPVRAEGHRQIGAGGLRNHLDHVARIELGPWQVGLNLRAVDNQMKVAREEVFGPVTIVIPYEGDAEALTIANDSDFGLAASIYSPDQERAWKMARQLQSGTVAINMAGISFAAPFGGYKKSGWGKECGPEGILAFTQVKQVVAA